MMISEGTEILEERIARQDVTRSEDVSVTTRLHEAIDAAMKRDVMVIEELRRMQGAEMPERERRIVAAEMMVVAKKADVKILAERTD